MLRADMQRRRVDLDVSGLAIDPAKEEYIRTAKGVVYDDILEVHENAPRYFQSHDRNGRERFAMIGSNRAGRYLLTAIEQVAGNEWRVISAYWLRTARGRRLYEET